MGILSIFANLVTNPMTLILGFIAILLLILALTSVIDAGINAAIGWTGIHVSLTGIILSSFSRTAFLVLFFVVIGLILIKVASTISGKDKLQPVSLVLSSLFAVLIYTFGLGGKLYSVAVPGNEPAANVLASSIDPAMVLAGAITGTIIALGFIRFVLRKRLQFGRIVI